MAPRRTRQVSDKTEGYTDGRLSKEARRKKAQLFIQQFRKEAQDRIDEMEARLEQLLASIDRVFHVELMKMPAALQNTLIQDLLDAEANDVAEGDVTVAMKTESPENYQPLTRKPSKKGALKRIPSTLNKRATTQPPKKGAGKTKSLAGSSSTGSLRSASTVSSSRTQSRVAKVSQTPLAGAKPRSASASDHMSCSMSGTAHVAISTAQGETFCISDEFKDDIDVGLLDDMAVLQMQRLMSLMNHLSNKAKELNHSV